MTFNLISNIESCFIAVRDTVPISLVYYSHIPTAIISLMVGFFVFFKSKRSLLGAILLAIAIDFSLWTFIDIILWTSYDSRSYMFFWDITLIFEPLLFILALYLIYVFTDKKDVSVKIKLIWFFLLLPFIAIIASSYYLTGFSIVDCVPIESSFYQGYALPFYGLIYIWILILSIRKYLKIEKERRKQLVFLFCGVSVLLILFLSGKILADYFIDKEIMTPTESYEFEFYGLFGMPIFIGFIAYIIVKFKAFDIKLIGAQALVYSLIILVGSQFFFIQNNTNRILTAVTLALTIGFGIYLIKSVKNEVKRKEELQDMADKLAAANDQLRKLDNAKSEFISIASHQLRTPLTAIKGFISLLMEGTYGAVEPKINDVLNKVYVANERLIQLVENLLNISRIEAGRIEYRFEKTKIEAVMHELEDTFALAAKEKKLYLHFKYPEKELGEIEMDSGKIREVTSNLIDNGLKYSKKGGVTVTLDGDNEKVKVIVSDTGIGIPEEEISYLFAKFSRGKDVSRLHVGGTGLGLYVGKSIIEAHHGKIWAESDGEGKGSRFIFEIPIVQPVG